MKNWLVSSLQRAKQQWGRFYALGETAGKLVEPPPPSVFRLRRGFELLRACEYLGERLRADAYIAHDETTLLAGGFLRSIFGGKLIFDAVEAIEPNEKTVGFANREKGPEYRLYTSLLEQLLGQTDSRLVTSQALGHYYEKKYGLSFDPLPNYSSLPPVEKGDSPIRDDLGCQAEDILVLYLNNIYLASRFEEVIQAFTLLPPHFHLVQLGSIFPQENRARFTAMARNSGVGGRVHFCAAKEYEKYFRYISGCDFGLVWLDEHNINCSLNLHNRYLDAVGAGLPVVSSKNSAFAALSERCHLGMISPDHSPEALAATLKAMGEQYHDFIKNVKHGQEELCWQKVSHVLTDHVGEAGSVVFLTQKNPLKNQRLQRQITTLDSQGVEVSGVGCLPAKAASLPGHWYDLYSTLRDGGRSL